ncbi:MAG: transcription-repair coupling factor [Candidatus Neomarinimicrobiota bacterium]|nr:MAG: transcription-repair coupling factor [Candidatus Neomarinimicrobiota bacterium]
MLVQILSQATKAVLLSCPDDRTAEDLYRLYYNFDPGHAFYFPSRSNKREAVQGFGVLNERYREETVRMIRQGTPGLIFTTSFALEEPAFTPAKKQEKEIRLQVGSTQCTREDLIEKLNSWGYESVPTCSDPKSFAVRGGIVDVFLPYSAHPLRIEFFGNTVESLRLFNPLSQRRIKEVESFILLPPSQLPEYEPELSFLETFPEQDRVEIRMTANQLSLSPSPQTPIPRTLPVQKFQDVSLSWIRSHEDAFREIVESFSKTFVFLETQEQLQAIQPFLSNGVQLVLGSVERHFQMGKQSVLGLSIARLFRRNSTVNTRWDLSDYRYQSRISSFTDLDWGDYLVHRDYGIGRYRGLEIIPSKKGTQECIRIDYRDGGKVYVPVEKFDRVHRLNVSEEHPPELSTLGTSHWQRELRRVRSSVQEVAQEIIETYRSRQRSRGFRYDPVNELYEELVASFPYEETADQKKAIEDVMSDLDRPQPMDRLICGDVGFGKTEVALRAILRVVISGKKVLFLAPTTILADQHFISSRSRLEPLGVRVELLSRFRTRKEQAEILEQMLRGQVDVVIGTHRLLSKDIHFPDLSLLIIDEEHRFGVRHKEKFRQLKHSLDVLTLTATPIPRTLQQSLSGIRQISRIETPPKTRKPILTEIHYFDWESIRRHLQFELDRNGQVYFLHNDVLSLPFYAEKLQKMFPDASIAVAHGQMSSRELERIVLAFFANQIDILVCTTIIESGLDVTNANTIVINEAHRFGLAQLYQIRGRVGRGHRQAYCYLLIPPGRTLPPQAHQRLKAIEQFTSLGSGYNVALKDLEIRGAGNLFGYKQSGHLAKVGFDLYCQILQEAVNDSMGRNQVPSPPVMAIQEDAFIPEDYMPLVQDRLYFYQQIATVASLPELQEIEEEVRDRFGPLPQPTVNLLQAAYFRIRFTGTPLRKVHYHAHRLRLEFGELPGDPSSLSLMTSVPQSQGDPYRFLPGSGETLTLEISSATKSWELYLRQYAEMLSTLSDR